tara:strand:+ start:231 stop:635 length:405 start_codon:yes stop_codon:yes gene_type:complete
MKKKIRYLAFFLLISFFNSSFSYAELKWKRIGANIDGDVYYIDEFSIKRVGNKVYYFTLSDYVRPSDTGGDLSAKIYQEVNCSDLSFRYLKDFYYLEPMGNGEPSTIYDKVGEWTDNVKGSIGEAVALYACNYK